MKFSSILEYLCVTWLAFAMIGQAASVSGYNAALALFGISCVAYRAPRPVFWFLLFTGFSLITDIVYAGIYGPGISTANDFPSAYHTPASNLATASLVFTCFNMFIKAAVLFFTWNLFTEVGGMYAFKTAGAADPMEGAGMPNPDQAGYQQQGVPNPYDQNYAAKGYQQGYQAPPPSDDILGGDQDGSMLQI